MLEVKITSRGYEINFDKWNPEFVADMHAIQNTRNGIYWNKKKKSWYVPAYMGEHVDRLKQKYGVMVDPVVEMKEQIGEIPPLPELDIDIPLKIELRHYQKQGIAYARKNKRLIIGDDMGLGKTAEAIATAISLECKCILVICPATLKLNWQIEWNKFAGMKSMILSDRNKTSWQTYYEVGLIKVFIVNYESLKKYFVQPGWSKPKVGEFKVSMIPFRDCIKLFDCVIIDESSKCKEGATQQSKMVIGICKEKEVVLELSGTPVVNKPVDLIAQLAIINKLKDVVSHIPQPMKDGKLQDHSGYTRFMNRYCEGGRGAINLKELNYRLQITGSFFRREKHQVLTELPDKVRQIQLCEITNRKEYDVAQDDFEKYLREIKMCTDDEVATKLRGQMMVKIGVLKQISARGKIEAAQQYIDEVLESGQKVIVFCHLKEIAAELRSLYPSFVTIIGDDSMQERQDNINAFQTNKNVPGIICSLTAAGMGVTLTAASEVLFIEFPWTFALCDQAESRPHRIGQLNSVRCGYLLGQGTIDQYCYDLIQAKKDIMQQVTGSRREERDQIVDSLLSFFDRKMKEVEV